MLNYWWIILLPIIAAAIGWFTNFIAIKMLFNPKEPKKILFFTVQGVFPKRQKQIAIKMGELVASQLISSADVKLRINNPKTIDSILLTLESKLDHYLEVTLPLKRPVISKLLTTKMKTKLKNEILEEVEKAAPTLLNQQMDKLEESFDVKQIVSDKVERLSSTKLENLISGILREELKFIEMVGAILGFLIGLIQVGITLLSGNI